MRALSLSKDERKIIYGKLKYVDWVMIRIAYNPKFQKFDKSHLLMECVKYGYLDIIKWVKPNENNAYIICEEAIKYGYIEILKWFNYKGLNLFNIEMIVKYNRSEILDYLWKSATTYHEYLIQYYAIKYNNVEMFKWSLITKKQKLHRMIRVEDIQWDIKNLL